MRSADTSLEKTHARASAKDVVIAPFKSQLLKWVGNKQKFAHEIVSYFPDDIVTYREPFLGSGAVLATLSPEKAVASDVFDPLMQIWRQLANDPEGLKLWYADRYAITETFGRIAGYERIRSAYNDSPNGPDFLFLTRSCYGGVVRFRKKDGYMSTPCGAHPPMKPTAFSKRVDQWALRVSATTFLTCDYRTSMAEAKRGDLVYCDPPYAHSQTILYGAQSFDLNVLFQEIDACKSRGVRVALSIDGSKKSGAQDCALDVPADLFVREVKVNLGRSMLKRFQMKGQSLENEGVTDRLLLTY